MAPTRFDLEAAAGDVLTNTIVVTATGAPADMQVRIDSFSYDLEGRPVRGTGPDERNLARWMKVATEPGAEDGRSRIDLQITVPADATGSYWAAVMVEWTVGTVATRFAVPVFLTVGTGEHGRLTTLDLEAVSTAAGVEVVWTLRNDTRFVARAVIDFSLERGSGDAAEEIAEAAATPAVLLPGGTRRVRALIATKNSERLRVLAFATVEGKAVAEAQGGVPAARPAASDL